MALMTVYHGGYEATDKPEIGASKTQRTSEQAFIVQ